MSDVNDVLGKISICGRPLYLNSNFHIETDFILNLN